MKLHAKNRGIMRAGVLIIGSLLWDEGPERDVWRQTRLRIENAVHVRAPIRYGRLSQSRGNTFTMVFSSSGQLGQAVLAPCIREVSSIAALVSEAKKLWRAEQPNAPRESIGAPWGCVGVLFDPHIDRVDCVKAWADYFHRNKVSPIHPVDRDGMLRIPWPAPSTDNRTDNIDIILATATRAETEHPSPEEIASAWIKQEMGYERYFFENIQHGIRTPDDLLVWKKIENACPSWLSKPEYAETAVALRGESR